MEKENQIKEMVRQKYSGIAMGYCFSWDLANKN
jgi:hypothetical protein